MCGIAGYYNFRDISPYESLKNMCDQISYRGPDDEGYYHNDVVGLGMRRLSIIDIDGGHQPMQSSNGYQRIVFNGEIYNYQQLRQQLRSDGSEFSTNSDTEVIIRAFEKTGPDMLKSLNGMFGIAIWDQAQKQLLLARDRMGIKPLYYYWDGTRFAFASEIKSILTLPDIEHEINHQAISDYLTFQYIPQPGTIWKHIYKLPPAHFLTIGEGLSEPKLNRYWTCNYSECETNRSPKQLEDEFEHLLLDCIDSCLVSDVPVGVLLSGGLDSAAITAGIKERHNGTLSTFSIAFEEGGKFNEFEYARQVSSHLSTDHHEVVIGNKEFVDFLPDFVRHSDEPHADLASVPLHYVSKLARGSVKVVLSGEGADEILGGYQLDQTMGRLDKLRMFHKLPTWLRRDFPNMCAAVAGNSKISQAIEKINLPIATRNTELLSSMTDFFSTVEKKNLLKSDQSMLDAKRNLKQIFNDAKTDDFLHQLMYMYQQDWLAEDLLMKADKMTMANSLELRVPFLDHRLVGWLAKTPSHSKVGKVGGKYQTKLLLREFARNRLPGSILDRPKLGFTVPENIFLRKNNMSLPRELLQSPSSRVRDILDDEVVERMIVEASSKPINQTDTKLLKKLWLLVILEYWMREWCTSS